ncbi:MAG: hypothetical protein ACPG31_12055 [Planctomycetota bacterium]
MITSIQAVPAPNELAIDARETIDESNSLGPPGILTVKGTNQVIPKPISGKVGYAENGGPKIFPSSKGTVPGSIMNPNQGAIDSTQNLHSPTGGVIRRIPEENVTNPIGI